MMFLEFGLAHYSNACWKFPNLGVNLPYLQVGLGYPLNLCPSIKKLDKQDKISPKGYYKTLNTMILSFVIGFSLILMFSIIA